MRATGPQRTGSGLAWDMLDLRAPWAPDALPVLLNHGIGTTADIWSDWLPVLAPHRAVARFDLRGFGASAAPPGHRFDMAGLVADAREVADAADFGRFLMIGESIGGTVALAAALALPERIAGLVVSNAAHRGSGVNRVRGWRAELEGDGLARWADAMLPARFAPDAPLAPAARAWFDRTQRQGDAEVIVALGELLAAADLSAELGRLAAPLLILAPDGSPFIPPAVAAELQALVPGARLQVFPGARHGLPLTHGAACAAAAHQFFTRHCQ